MTASVFFKRSYKLVSVHLRLLVLAWFVNTREARRGEARPPPIQRKEGGC